MVRHLDSSSPPGTAPTFGSGAGFLVIFVLGFVVISLCLSCAKCLYQKFSLDRPTDTTQALLNNNFLDCMPGFTRSDIDDGYPDAERWKCSICAFWNVVGTSACLLCGTANEVLGAPALDRSTSYQKFLALLYSKATAPAKWNARQRSARLRLQWTRETDARISWTRHFTHSKHNPAHVLQVVPSSTMDNEVNIAWESTVVHSTRVDGGALPRMIGVGQSPVRLSGVNDACELHSSRMLQWTDATSDTAASCTVMGDTFPRWKWDALLAVSQIAFPLKYTWFLQQVADLVTPYAQGHLCLSTNRTKVFCEAMESMLKIDDNALCCIARFEFHGEPGIDAGAVQREWYLLVAQGLMQEDSGLLFLSNRDDHSYFINPNSDYAFKQSSDTNLNHLEAYRAMGRYIGRVLLDGQVIPLRLNAVLFKVMLGTPLSLDDVECLDPAIYKSLLYILENANVDALMLTFSATERRGNGVVEVDLIENGQHLAVTETNKVEYVDLMVKYLLFGRVQHQMMAFLEGLHEIVPPEILVPFDHKELELVLCGLGEIDVDDWKHNTIVSLNLRMCSVVDWFWEILQAMSSEDRARLLQFSTGSSRVPVQGFRALTSYDGKICYFNLKGISYTPGAYPVIHACYNRVDLPMYPTKALLEEAVQTLLLSDPTGFSIE
ncbi:Aste57867_11330 [Aphanomyces stellatus]|uniref:HECT-type E3 ubiquitin transferase n=1 Tax=Aphanomyces stellatus TaxID=120398 RepID=A0A485KSM3_9STRA|nr:hypothetical protein As57867_011288 [Aphanomyces stellatus]VFT88192.1 Aste57867_11330 [Aphanomyces stellatus]